MAAEDPLTPGEIRRAIARLEGEDRSLADRLTRVAADMLPVKLWDAENRALGDKLDRHEKASDAAHRRIERDLEELRDKLEELREEREKHSDVTWTKVIGLITALATLAAVIVGVVGLTKGIK